MLEFFRALRVGNIHSSIIARSLSRVQVFGTPWTAAGFLVLYSLPELAQTQVHWVGDAIQPSHPLSSPSPPALNLSQHQSFFQWVSSSHQVAKVLELQLQHQSSNEYSGLISFRMDWFDLLAVQGILKSLFQHHSSKALILHSAFFMVQLSHPYMNTGKTIALASQTFVGKVLSLLFNMLSRFFHCFSFKDQASFNFMAAVTNYSDFGALIIVSPSICHEMVGPDTIILVFWMLSFNPALCSRKYYTVVQES